MGSVHMLAIYETKLWKNIFCFCHYCFSGLLLLSKPNPEPGGLSKNCAPDFFHSWITPSAGFITTTSTSCCSIKYKVALRFISLAEIFFTFFCFRHLSVTYVGLQQMYRAYLSVSAQCLCMQISTGITRAASQLN